MAGRVGVLRLACAAGRCEIKHRPAILAIVRRAETSAHGGGLVFGCLPMISGFVM